MTRDGQIGGERLSGRPSANNTPAKGSFNLSVNPALYDFPQLFVQKCVYFWFIKGMMIRVAVGKFLFN